jgi:hypothetical protein
MFAMHHTNRHIFGCGGHNSDPVEAFSEAHHITQGRIVLGIDESGLFVGFAHRRAEGFVLILILTVPLGKTPDSGIGSTEQKILRLCVRGKPNQNNPGSHISVFGIQTCPFSLLKE